MNEGASTIPRLQPYQIRDILNLQFRIVLNGYNPLILGNLGRLRDRSRKVLEVTEVLGYWDGEIRLQTLYKYTELQEEEGKIQGEWRKIQEIAHKEKLLAAAFPNYDTVRPHTQFGKGVCNELSGSG